MGLYFSIMVVALAGAAAPTSLYETYSAAWGGTPFMTTIAFSVYAAGILTGLLCLGDISSTFGRRPVIAAGLACQVLAMTLFLLADSYASLLAARVVQGLGIGTALGALGAGMVSSAPARGPIANAAAPGVGTGLGALIAGLMATYLPWPTYLIYTVLAAAMVLQLGLLFRTADPHARHAWRASTLIPRLRVPQKTRGRFVIAALTSFLAWAVPGYYSSLSPAVANELAATDQPLLGGLVLFGLAAVGVGAAVGLRTRPPRTAIVVALAAALIAALFLLVTAGLHTTRSSAEDADVAALVAYCCATAAAGITYGAGLQGATRYVLARTDEHQQAALLSAVWVAAYVGNSVPVVICGYLAVHGYPLLNVVAGFGGGMLICGLLTSIALQRLRHRERAHARPTQRHHG